MSSSRQAQPLRYTRANTLKQLAFFHAEHHKYFSPKMFRVVHKRLLTRPLKLSDVQTSLICPTGRRICHTDEF